MVSVVMVNSNPNIKILATRLKVPDTNDQVFLAISKAAPVGEVRDYSAMSA